MDERMKEEELKRKWKEYKKKRVGDEMKWKIKGFGRDKLGDVLDGKMGSD